MRSYNSALFCLIGVSMTLAAPAALASEGGYPVLEPVSPWNLDVGEHKCRLARLFGDKADPSIFFIDQWHPSSRGEWTLAGPEVARYREKRQASYEFSDGGDSGDFEFLGATFEQFGSAIMYRSKITANSDDEGEDEHEEDFDSSRDYVADPRGLPSFDAEGAKPIKWFTVSQRGRSTVKLKLGSMKDPLAAMNVCMEDLVERWGLDIEEQRTVARPPEITNMATVVSRIQQVYPSRALRRGAQADFHIRMIIDTEGAIESCVLLSQTTADAFTLDDHPCKVFERHAKITPAQNAQGQPVRTYLTNRIKYRIS